MAKSDRYKVVYIRKNGQKLKRWKDTHTGKILVSRPFGGGELGVGSGKKLTNSKKVNKKVTQTQNKNWEETHKKNIEKLKSGTKSGLKKTGEVLKSTGRKIAEGVRREVAPRMSDLDTSSKSSSSSSSSSPNNESKEQFLKRTKNSPAAKSGMSDAQRWAARKNHLDFLARRKAKKKKKK